MHAWGEHANVTQKIFRWKLNLQPSCCEPTVPTNCTIEQSQRSFASHFPEFKVTFTDCLLLIFQHTSRVLVASILSEISACLGKRSKLNMVSHSSIFFICFSFPACKKLVPMSSSYLCERQGISWANYKSITERHGDE